MAIADIHLKLGDIKGESTDDKHKDEIDVESWSWGASNPALTVGTGSGSGKVSFSDLNFVHKIDKASPNLWKACASGEHIKEATLTSAKQGKGPQDFMIVKLSDVMITSVSLAGSANGGSVPMEQISMNYAKVEMEYKPQKPDGSLDAGIQFKYDVRANKEG